MLVPMKISLQQVVTSLVSLLIAVLVVVFISDNPGRLGEEPLVVRALVLSVAIFAALVAVYPLNPLFTDRPGTYAGIVCVPALIPGFIFYLFLLPGKAGQGFEAEQLATSLITDRTSNGIIEVGFRYPIYTPTIAVKNRELFTRHVNLFLRMTEVNGEEILFRAVRLNVPGNGLSVESAVQGMLSETQRYLFNPIEIPPDRTLEGQVVFIISNLEDTATFTDALESSNQVNFEIRDPQNGQLLLEFPLQHI